MPKIRLWRKVSAVGQIGGFGALPGNHKPALTQDQVSAKLARIRHASGLVNINIDRAGISKIETGSRRVYDFAVVDVISHFSSVLDLS
jgi:hypothetical protein